MQIGNVFIEQTAALAPMASVCDYAYRSLCKEYGAAYLVSEMVSAKGLCYQPKRASDLLRITPNEHPMAIQLFGSEPEYFARAIPIVLSYHPDVIDINMGCPVPKVVSSGGGSALMKHPKLAGEIVSAAVLSSSVPVTVKIRKGWDSSQENAVEFGKRMEACGAAAITIHARTRAQMYQGDSDWETIACLKQAVGIPVIGNGDVKTPEDAARMYEETGVDLVMVGRGSYGKPWLFAQIAAYLRTGTYPPDPPLARRMEIMLRHVQRICEDKGEVIGMKEARSHAGRYLTGVFGAARFREKCGKLQSFSDVQELAREVVQSAQER